MEKSIKLTSLNRKEALRYLGYKKNAPDERVEELMDECEELVLKTAVPRFIYNKVLIFYFLSSKINKEKNKNLLVSSTKSMTGHLLGATGAIEAIASVMALNEGVIPPTINLDEPDEGLDLNYTPNKAVKRDVNVAASTNLGFGGHDACLVFKKY